MKIISTIELFIVALIWGTAFVAQSVGMDYLGPCAFNASRFTVGAVILIPVIFMVKAMDRKEKALSTHFMTQSRVESAADAQWRQRPCSSSLDYSTQL